MKRSAAVPLTLVATAAAGALLACRPGQEPEPLNCVESTSGRVVPDSLCRAAGAARPAAGASGGTAGHAGSSGGFYPGFFGWYYGGRVISGLVRGGSYAPVAGRSYRSPTGSFLGAGATRSGGAVRPSLGSPANARTSTGGSSFGGSSVSRPSARGGFGGTGAGRFGGS